MGREEKEKDRSKEATQKIRMCWTDGRVGWLFAAWCCVVHVGVEEIVEHRTEAHPCHFEDRTRNNEKKKPSPLPNCP